MGGAACVIIINGGRAYAATETLAEEHININTLELEAAIRISCDIITYVSTYLHISDKYTLTELYTQPIIDLHNRIIKEFPTVKKDKAQKLVDEIKDKLYEASENVSRLLD